MASEYSELYQIHPEAHHTHWQLFQGLGQKTETGLSKKPSKVKQTSSNIKVTFKCNCNRTLTKFANESNSTVPPGGFRWCSAESSARGAHQKVIAYSLFGTGTKENVSAVSNRYDSLLRKILIAAEKLYSGWIVRIYHNFHSENDPGNIVSKQLCELHCQFNHLDLCSVTDIIGNIPALTPIDPALLRGLNGRMFRFLVMLDPNVDVFISRDTDSVILQREVDAVDEWLRSNYTFHLMRDHKNHTAIILAGMWGVKLHQRRDLIEGLTRAMILAGQDQVKSTDQTLLDKIVWPAAQYDVMAHDSYHCQRNELKKKSPLKVLPFPTMRNGSYFVGGVGENSNEIPSKCPVTCRPPDHKDWEYC
ncbi:uncharacterized protein LOC124199264 isoform X2 [Daphnia pulex]|uniref:uncharacterized protein LOC124199264 isoform X2 n=1 Tax=Daphnia pulex TaxID=6669 RepID=UPI001EDDB957|nr:uncharacterized protein LOC124199264 isoform X2 [Daphnia pulex]XP_046450977.1 uncharacterized protein LOC124199264 isoform X2 [Daphnia pulex]XP_046450978.1 uncharacterized protein LOC124199264 isoform X2 [Daphnia pulex]XP_046450979.1 uncharacterized protein LOC124199264 isoform X2 [Daphnia pulex]XP_046450980.1 uncharacterized protein LOC124199264 isoform X2 [Daphnia pulex]XP_046450981.1 uncharacterized protein LOC124199264 isoform X2 [Daphnia pulex]